jgi:HD-GYP domain-containing protein (c-di-GMP phosphodiesterase class II)
VTDLIDQTLISIDPRAIPRDDCVPFNLFMVTLNDPVPVEIPAGRIFDAAALDQIVTNQHRLLIRAIDRRKCHTFLKEHLTAAELDVLAVAERLSRMHEVMRMDLEQVFESKATEDIFRTAQHWAPALVDTMFGQSIPLVELNSVLRHDAEYSTHVCKVAVYLCRLAEIVGVPRDRMAELVTSAMVCDIGMLDVPDYILSKTTALSNAEMAVVRKHVVHSLDRLSTVPGITRDELRIAIEHHERIDGSGYPIGLPGNLIHPWAKLLAIVDVFAALTSKRPHRPAFARSKALTIMAHQADKLYDLESFRCWQSINQEAEMLQPMLSI